VPVGPETLLLLNNIGDREHLWLNKDGEPMAADGLERLYYGTIRRADIAEKAKWKPLVARNTAALHFLLDGGHPEKLRELLGVEEVAGPGYPGDHECSRRRADEGW